MDLKIVEASFLSELDKIAAAQPKEHDPKKLTTGESLLALLAGGPQAVFGAKKAREAGGSALEGGLRGAGGFALGQLPGSYAGGALGGLAGKAVGHLAKADPYLSETIGQSLGRIGGGLGGGIAGYKALTGKFNQPQEKAASPLTETAREHISKKNFAVAPKASNTGKPAYPIEDKKHARIALGLSKMHGDSKDIAEVKKDVESKYPGMVHDKNKTSCMDGGSMKSAMVFLKVAFNVGEAVHHGLAEAGPAAGATLGAALMGGMGKNPLTGAAAGYGLGSLPEMLLSHGKGKKAA